MRRIVVSVSGSQMPHLCVCVCVSSSDDFWFSHRARSANEYKAVQLDSSTSELEATISCQRRMDRPLLFKVDLSNLGTCSLVAVGGGGARGAWDAQVVRKSAGISCNVGIVAEERQIGRQSSSFTCRCTNSYLRSCRVLLGSDQRTGKNRQRQPCRWELWNSGEASEWMQKLWSCFCWEDFGIEIWDVCGTHKLQQRTKNTHKVKYFLCVLAQQCLISLGDKTWVEIFSLLTIS